MKWISEWRALSKRIDRLHEAAEFIVSCDKSIGLKESAKAVEKIWLPTIESTSKDLVTFVTRCRSLIFPNDPDEHLRHLANHRVLFGSLNWQFGNPIQEMQYKLSSLLAARAQLDHLIGDFEFFARRTIERSFAHLQRMLMVDKGLNKLWLRAFQKREMAVEKLGAVHLLGHGIWAFKVDATGERTDLVLGEPLKNVQEDVNRTAEVLALTEWKIIKNHKDKKEIESKIEDALRQAKLYASGSLAGIELEKWRYLVLVSLGRIPIIKDLEENNIVYRHINIAISPVTPSKEKS